MSSRTSRSRSVSSNVGRSLCGGKTVLPRPTRRTARTISVLDQSFETKPDAPAACAALREMRPAPEISSTFGAGNSWRSRSQMSAPDSSPTNRSTSATCGSNRRVCPIASSALRALRQRVTQGCWLNSRRKPQWTTSWSSTIKTASLRPARSRSSVFTGRHHEPDLPLVAVACPELDEAAHLQRLERGQAEAHPGGALRRAVHAVVHDLEHEDPVGLTRANGDLRRARMLLRVAQRLAQHGLRQCLQVDRHVQA